MYAKQLPRQRRWWLLILALAAGLAVIAAACSDDDFDGAPDDRGAAAAATVGAELPVDDESAGQAAQPGDQAQDEAADQADDEAADQAADQAEDDADDAADEQAEAQVVEQADDQSDAVVVEVAGDAAAGQELFIANGCNACHGDSGEGNIGPTIAQTGFTLDQVIGQYRNPRGFMPPFLESKVSDAQVADIYAWLQTQPLPDTIVPGEGTP